MKKGIWYVLIIILVLGLCACGDGTTTEVVPYPDGGRQETVKDIEGNVLSFMIYTIEGNVIFGEQNEYDKNGNLTKKTLLGSGGKISQILAYNYGDDDIMDSVAQYDGEGNLIFELPCDAEGNVIDGFIMGQ